MPPLIHRLLRPEAYPHPVDRLDLLETHISWVILTGPFAYKLKKPVDFGFVNFTTLDLRERFCHEELRLNRRTAADLYLDVQPVFGPVDAASFVGEGEPIEFAVRMRQFPQDALLPNVLARRELRPEHLDQFAVELARFQRDAAVADESQPFGKPDAVRAPIAGNFAVLDQLTDQADVVARLRDWSAAEFAKLSDTFAARKQAGRVREGHGDLHLGNMVLLHDAVQAFDCLEFNDGLRWIDVVSEIAFLVMDLQERGRADLAFCVLNRWLEQTGDYAGLVTWRWYFVYRALVRAKVATLRLRQPDLSDDERAHHKRELANYLALAERWTQPRPAAVLLTHGVSGSGKSVVSARLCEECGAIRLRSDVERKRLFGQWGDPVASPLSGELYAPAVTQQVYRDRLASLVPAVLAGGFPVVIDATGLCRWQRDLFRDLAAQHAVPFVLLDVQADEATLRDRIRQRQTAGHDPSDADTHVLEMQLRTREPLGDDERVGAIVVRTDQEDWWPALHSQLACGLASPPPRRP
jgi:aminoglycoside phosphotransferase family enzyme/predicted kinase